MGVEIKEAYGYIKDIKVLFDEYTSSLGVDLSFQNYDEEYKTLPGKYARPDGRLYLACSQGIAAGCVGLRKIDEQTCEMKRLYVRRQFRGLSIGKMLAEQVIHEARAIGYQSIVLDSLPTMERARMLYKNLGFMEIAPYYESRIQDTHFLSLSL